MVVYNSMLILVLILMFIYHNQVPNERLRSSRPIPWIYAIISMGYIVFWASLRSGFVDTSAYIRNFQNAPENLNAIYNLITSDEKDVGFKILTILFKSYISKDFHFWLGFIAISTGVPIAIAFRNHSPNFLYSMFLFISSVTVVWMFNGIRQFMAAAILLGFGYLIEKKKLLKFLIVLTICATIHGTAWLFLPMYFFVTDKPFGKRMIIFILAVLTCAISVAPLMDSMETVLADTNYSENLKQFAEDDGVHPLRVLFSCIPVFLAFLKKKEISRINNHYINMCVNMSTVAAGLYFVGMFTSGIMIGRLPIYFSMYGYILIPYMLEFLYPRSKKLLYSGLSIVYLVFYILMARNFYYISDILGNYA